MINKLIAIPQYFKLLKKYNTLENDYELLKNNIKENLFNSCLEQTNVQSELQRLKKENKNLRMKVKNLREIIKEDKS